MREAMNSLRGSALASAAPFITRDGVKTSSAFPGDLLAFGGSVPVEHWGQDVHIEIDGEASAMILDAAAVRKGNILTPAFFTGLRVNFGGEIIDITPANEDETPLTLPLDLEIKALNDVTTGVPGQIFQFWLEGTGLTAEMLSLWKVEWTTPDTGTWENVDPNFPKGNARGGLKDSPGLLYAWRDGDTGAKTVTCTLSRPGWDDVVLNIGINIVSEVTEFHDWTVIFDPSNSYDGPADYNTRPVVKTWDAAVAQVEAWGRGQMLIRPGTTVTKADRTEDKVRMQDFDSGRLIIRSWDETDVVNIEGHLLNFNVELDQKVILRYIRLYDSYNTHDFANSETVGGQSVRAFGVSSAAAASSVHMYGCIFEGVESGITNAAGQYCSIINLNCNFGASNGWEDYAYFTAEGWYSGIAFSTIKQPDNSRFGFGGKEPDNPRNSADHGGVRAQIIGPMFMLLFIDAGTLGSGWSQSGILIDGKAAPFPQAWARLGSLSCRSDAVLYVTDCYSEGYLSMLGGASGGTACVTDHCIIKNCMMLQLAYNGFAIGHTNTWLVNCISIIPDMLDWEGDKNRKAFRFTMNNDANPASTHRDGVLRVINHTILDLRTEANANPNLGLGDLYDTDFEYLDEADWPDIQVHNLQVLVPYRAPAGEDGPVFPGGVANLNTEYMRDAQWPGYTIWDHDTDVETHYPNNAVPANNVLRGQVLHFDPKVSRGRQRYTPAADWAGDIREFPAMVGANNPKRWWKSEAVVAIDYDRDQVAVDGVIYDSVADAISSGAIIVGTNGVHTIDLPAPMLDMTVNTYFRVPSGTHEQCIFSVHSIDGTDWIGLMHQFQSQIRFETWKNGSEVDDWQSPNDLARNVYANMSFRIEAEEDNSISWSLATDGSAVHSHSEPNFSELFHQVTLNGSPDGALTNPNRMRRFEIMPGKPMTKAELRERSAV
jgi:hypothetical protein